MRSVTSRNHWFAAGLAITTLAIAASSSFAERGDGSSQGDTTTVSGKRSGEDIVSVVRFSAVTAGGKGFGVGNVTPVGGWRPPICWYEPRSAQEFAAHVEHMYDETINAPGQANYAKSSVGEFRHTYKDGEYQNYNLDKADEGSWWVAVRDENRRMEPEAQACDREPFWVESGDTPEVPQAITSQVLAELAYNRLHLPDTELTLAPAGVTKVNLPTWAWLDKARFREVSVTASLRVADINIQATTTAKPISLKLEPGTDDAATYPTSGICALGVGDTIGQPYATGNADQTPPCGIKYLRSSGTGTYKLTAVITWRVDWTGTGGVGGDLPDGVFGTTQDVTVQEIQAVNR
ncbi:hypothetical protein [Streptomyces adustus]|uniref:hypothetical protein n=1 Tax=Streptomyces adustus TaxID=1609272 RepID=UPI003712D198